MVKDACQAQLRKLGLREDVANYLMAKSEISLLPKRSIIMKMNEEIKAWHLVLSGKIGEFSDIGSQPFPQYLLSSGAWIGHESVSPEGRSKMYRVALSAVSILRIPLDLMMNCLVEEPAFSRRVLHRVAVQDQFRDDRCQALRVGSHAFRLLSGLLNIAYVFNPSIFEKDPAVTASRFSLRHQWVARFCGIDDDFLANTLQALSKDGWVELNEQEVILNHIHIWLRAYQNMRGGVAFPRRQTQDDLLNELQYAKISDSAWGDSFYRDWETRPAQI